MWPERLIDCPFWLMSSGIFLGTVHVILRDDLIRLFAVHQSARYGDEFLRSRDINLIRTKIRSIARLVIELEQQTGRTLSRIGDYLTPRHYDLVTSCVRALGEKRSPQLALTLGHYVKQLTLLKIAESIKQEKKAMLVDAENFLRLFNASWCQTVSSSTSRIQRLRKLQKTVELPTADDIVKLSQFIRDETLEATHNEDVQRLKKLTLAGLILFNKRRPMEVEELTYADFKRAKQRKKDDHTSEIVQSLSTSETMVAKR